MSADAKIQKYNELQSDINTLVFKSKKSPKECDKLDQLYAEQDELCKDQDVMDYINQRFAQ
jgi:hypothetical protein